MEIHGTRVSRLPHRPLVRGRAKPRPSRPRSAAADSPVHYGQYEGRAETRSVHVDSCPPHARRAIAAYLAWGRAEIPDTLVRLDCYA